MVYTEIAPRRQQFLVAPAMPALKYTTSVDIKKEKKKSAINKTWSLIQNHMRAQ